MYMNIIMAVKMNNYICVLSYLINPKSHKERMGSKNGVPPGYEPGVARTTMHCPPLARHSRVAAQAAIS